MVDDEFVYKLCVFIDGLELSKSDYVLLSSLINAQYNRKFNKGADSYWEKKFRELYEKGGSVIKKETKDEN